MPYPALYLSSAGELSIRVCYPANLASYFDVSVLCYIADSAFVQASFRNRHPGMHGLHDMAFLVGGKWYKEFVGFMYMFGCVHSPNLATEEAKLIHSQQFYTRNRVRLRSRFSCLECVIKPRSLYGLVRGLKMMDR